MIFILSPLAADLKDCRSLTDAQPKTWPDDIDFDFPYWNDLDGIEVFCLWHVQLTVSYIGLSIDIRFSVDEPTTPSFRDNMFWGFSDFAIIICKPNTHNPLMPLFH